MDDLLKHSAHQCHQNEVKLQSDKILYRAMTPIQIVITLQSSNGY